MRAIWKGAINFGLVNIPVKLMTATSRNNIRFRNLHQECSTPVKMKRFCPSCEREVDYGELVKGYEYEDNRFVILREEDFKNLPVKSTRTIDIVDFVELEEIDPIYYSKTYYLRPAEGGEKPYFLLKRAMDRAGRAAVTRITIRSKESLAVIRGLDDVLALETMYFAGEVRPAEALNLESLENQIEVTGREEEMALELIENLTAAFKPEKYRNEYREELMELIRRKIEGREIETPEPVPEAEKVVDLMEKLKASVESTRLEENTEEEEREPVLEQG
ncbi:MAG: Ku protein [Halanaerobiaceae bacterium]